MGPSVAWVARKVYFKIPLGSGPLMYKFRCNSSKFTIHPSLTNGEICVPLCDHLAAIFVPSIGLEDVISHVETLTKFTQKPLNDSNQAISLLNSEVSVMRKAVLQNRMALDIFTASQGGTDAIIQAERCVYTPDKSSNVTYLMTHLKNLMAA